jgi:hypothetical protein
MSQAARRTCADPLRRPGRVANKKPLLHLRDDLARDVQLGAYPVNAVGVEPQRRLGHNGGGVELIRDRHPVLAPESSLGEPAANLPPTARIVGAFALDPPTQPGTAMLGRVVVDADNA